MIVASIESFPLRIPLRTATKAPAVWGDKGLAAVDSLLIRVTTADGLHGWGEAFGFRATSSAKLALDEIVAPLCIGSDVSGVAPLMLELQKKLQVFGRNGALFYALSALDIALWDIAGKAANMPLYRLLGGGAADLACYASLTHFSDAGLVREETRRAVDAGFRSLKLHETDLSVIRAGRMEVGGDVELMVDVNCAWTLAQARQMADELKELRLKWLEEPVWPPENFAALAELRRGSGIAIAAGENVSTLMDFERLMAANAVDFVQPSAAKMGGISELRRVFPIAAIHNVAVTPHSFYDGPGLLAALHATAALGSPDSVIEWRDVALEAQIYGDALSPHGGRISVPQGPGLGLEPDPEVIRAYTRAASTHATH